MSEDVRELLLDPVLTQEDSLGEHAFHGDDSRSVASYACPDLRPGAQRRRSAPQLPRPASPRGLTVNAVASVLVGTDTKASWLRTSSEVRAKGASLSAFGRLGSPQDVADVMAFLASEHARFVTGQVVDARAPTAV
jgi:hypothetical protein